MSNNPEEYCRQKIAAAGTSFYYSTLYFPEEIKRQLYPLHAFAAELEEIITECPDPGIARIKLGWWLEETQRLKNGIARHPVTKQLLEHKICCPENEAFMVKLIRHYEQQINMEAPENYQSLVTFLNDGPGLLWELSAKICNPHLVETPGIVSFLGSQFGWFQVLQNTYDNLQKNRNYWPRDEISVPGEENKFYAFQIRRLLQELEEGLRRIAEIDRGKLLHALIMARIIIRTCEEIGKSGYHLDREKITLTPFRKLWIAWRTYRKT